MTWAVFTQLLVGSVTIFAIFLTSWKSRRESRAAAASQQISMLQREMSFAGRIACGDVELASGKHDIELLDALARCESLWILNKGGIIDTGEICTLFGRRILAILSDPYVRSTLIPRLGGATYFESCEKLRRELMAEFDRRQIRVFSSLAHVPLSCDCEIENTSLLRFDPAAKTSQEQHDKQ